MPQIDALLTQMQRGGSNSAVLRGDAPTQFSSPSTGLTQGAVLSNVRVEEILREIMPSSALQSLDSAAFTQFEYSSPLGPCQVEARRTDGLLELQVTPSFQAAAPFAAGNPSPYIPAAVNDSGQPNAVLPAELQGFNWGGLTLSWIWAAGNSAWIGLLGLIPCVSLIVRIVLGVKGNEWAWRGRRWDSVEQFRSTQKNWTIAGLIIFLGGNLVCIPIYLAILFPVFGRARENARRSVCQQNMKIIALGALQYYTDNGKFPTGTTMASWETSLKSYTKDDKFYLCPSAAPGEESYVLNPAMAGVDPNKLADPVGTPLFFDGNPTRHLEGINVAFADGHVKFYRESKFKTDVLPHLSGQ